MLTLVIPDFVATVYLQMFICKWPRMDPNLSKGRQSCLRKKTHEILWVRLNYVYISLSYCFSIISTHCEIVIVFLKQWLHTFKPQYVQFLQQNWIKKKKLQVGIIPLSERSTIFLYTNLTDDAFSPFYLGNRMLCLWLSGSGDGRYLASCQVMETLLALILLPRTKASYCLIEPLKAGLMGIVLIFLRPQTRGIL